MLNVWKFFLLFATAPTASEEGAGAPPVEPTPAVPSDSEDLITPGNQEPADPEFDEALEGLGAEESEPAAGTLPAEPSPVTPPPPPSAKAPAEPPVAAPPEPPVPPVAVEPQPPAEPPPSQPPAAPKVEEPAAPARTSEEVAAERAEGRKKWVSELEKKYAIPEDQYDALLTSPQTVLPILAAQVHAAVAEEVINTIISNLPQLVGGITTRMTQEQKYEADFFARWTKLNDAEGRKMVEKILPSYINSNPKVTVDDIMRDVGIMAMVALKRPIEASPTPGTPPPVVPTPPTPPAGYTPAAPGAGGGAPVKLGVWESMAEELIHED